MKDPQGRCSVIFLNEGKMPSPQKGQNPPKHHKQPVSKKGLIMSNRTDILDIIFFFL